MTINLIRHPHRAARRRTRGWSRTSGRALVVLVLLVLALPDRGSASALDFAALVRDACASYPGETARLAVGDGFLQFESSTLHGEIAARDPALYRDVEMRWLALAAAMKTGAPEAEVQAQGAALADLLAAAAGTRADGSPSSLFVDALLIIVREGFEAILILTALAAYLVKVGQAEKRGLLYAGGGAAVAASLGLAALAGRALPMGGRAREALEGITMLIAVVVLFSTSYWLISKSEARRWQAFVRIQLEGALGSGRGHALFLVAFLVVFREGFETVLFYQALAGRAGGAALELSAVGFGFGLGVLLLAGIALALFRYGVRIPIRPFFAVTGALLYLLAFKFAGAGVRELQEAGLVAATPVAMPDMTLLRDWLAVYPFFEPLAAQAVLLFALVAGGLYTALAGRDPALGGVEARP